MIYEHLIILKKNSTGQGDDYTAGCLIDYPYFKKDFCKPHNLDTDPKAIQQVNFTINLEENNATMFFIIEEAKETFLDFPKGTVKML